MKPILAGFTLNHWSFPIIWSSAKAINFNFGLFWDLAFWLNDVLWLFTDTRFLRLLLFFLLCLQGSKCSRGKFVPNIKIFIKLIYSLRLDVQNTQAEEISLLV